jgi:hypothetical protein
MKKLIADLVYLVVLLGTVPAQALILAITPSSQVVTSGSPAIVSLSIAGLDGATAVGGFDLDFSFNPSILSLRGVSFGDPTLLGDQLDLARSGAIICSPGHDTSPFCPADLAGGMANLLELSLDTPNVLNALQADSFILATFLFDTLSPGQSFLSVDRLVLADAFGAGLSADIQSSRIIVAAPNAIPAPSSLGLLVVGMLMLRACNKKQSQRPRCR